MLSGNVKHWLCTNQPSCLVAKPLNTVQIWNFHLEERTQCHQFIVLFWRELFFKNAEASEDIKKRSNREKKQVSFDMAKCKWNNSCFGLLKISLKAPKVSRKCARPRSTNKRWCPQFKRYLGWQSKHTGRPFVREQRTPMSHHSVSYVSRWKWKDSGCVCTEDGALATIGKLSQTHALQPMASQRCLKASSWPLRIIIPEERKALVASTIKTAPGTV